jgi:hypothetical protein
LHLLLRLMLLGSLVDHFLDLLTRIKLVYVYLVIHYDLCIFNVLNLMLYFTALLLVVDRFNDLLVWNKLLKRQFIRVRIKLFLLVYHVIINIYSFQSLFTNELMEGWLWWDLVKFILNVLKLFQFDLFHNSFFL